MKSDQAAPSGRGSPTASADRTTFDTDVIVIGGGGSGLAAPMRRRRIKPAVMDRGREHLPPRRFPDGDSERDEIDDQPQS